jgi:hypothetical protein
MYVKACLVGCSAILRSSITGHRHEKQIPMLMLYAQPPRELQCRRSIVSHEDLMDPGTVPLELI